MLPGRILKIPPPFFGLITHHCLIILLLFLDVHDYKGDLIRTYLFFNQIAV
jgi:hypothetical protein